jgi:diacylglycerol kinase family enzyme
MCQHLFSRQFVDFILSVFLTNLEFLFAKFPLFFIVGDGTLDLILVKRSRPTGFLRFLWQVARDSRSIDNLPNVERYHVREVRVRSLHNERNNHGHWSCDGELIVGDDVCVRVQRQVLTLFASGINITE